MLYLVISSVSFNLKQSLLLYYLSELCFLFVYLFINERHRERGRDRQREKQAPCREPHVGLYPRTPGSGSGQKAGAKPLSHPGIPRCPRILRILMAGQVLPVRAKSCGQMRRSINWLEEFSKSAKESMGARGVWGKKCLEIWEQNRGGLEMPPRVSCGHWRSLLSFWRHSSNVFVFHSRKVPPAALQNSLEG